MSNVEHAYNILEELDLLLSVAKAYGPNYFALVPESTYRILNLIQTIPDLSFIERQDIETIEEYHQRLHEERWVKQRGFDWEFYIEDVVNEEEEDDYNDYED